MEGSAKKNGEMRYLLTVIDVFFKFAWAIPVHSKDAKAITTAFGHVLTTVNPRHTQRLQTDKGKEFVKSKFQALLKRHGIQHFASKSEQNAAVVERLNRTIKTRIWHIYQTATPCAGWMSSRTLLTLTTIRDTVPSTWLLPMFRRRTKTVSGCAFSETETLKLNL